MTMYGLVRQKLSREFGMAPEQLQLDVDNILTEQNQILNSKAFFDFLVDQSQNFEINADFYLTLKEMKIIVHQERYFRYIS